MQSNNKLTIPDLISIGVFTAIYFVLVTIATFASALLLPGVSNIFLPAIAALISGSVYMLLAAKLQKFGGITIMGLVMGLFFFVSGHFVLSFAANILFGWPIGWPRWASIMTASCCSSATSCSPTVLPVPSCRCGS